MSSSCRRRPFEYAPRPSGRYDSRAKVSFAACHVIVRSSILLFTCENKTFMSERTSSSSACTQLQPSAASPPSPAAHNPMEPTQRAWALLLPPPSNSPTVPTNPTLQLHFLPKQQYCNRVGPQNFQFRSSRKKRSTHKTEIAKTTSNKPISK